MHTSSITKSIATFKLAIFFAAFTLSGCATMGNSFFSGSAQGINKTVSSDINAAVINTRREAASLSAKDIKIVESKKDEALLASPERVLKGTARSISGIQIVDAELFMVKPDYTDGYLVLNEGFGENKYSILSFEKEGSYDSEFFNFIYLLANDSGEISSLTLLGSKYKQDGKNFTAYEGTLIFPGVNVDWQNYRDAYKIDFGYQIPQQSEFEQTIAKAKDQSKKINSLISTLNNTQIQIDNNKAKISDIQLTIKKSSNPGPLEDEIKLLNGEIEKLKNQISGLEPEVEYKMSDLMHLRSSIDSQFAEFTQSNQYTWLPARDQNRYFSRWEAAASIDTDIEKYMNDLRQFITYYGKLKNAYESMKRKISQYNIQQKDPMLKN